MESDTPPTRTAPHEDSTHGQQPGSHEDHQAEARPDPPGDTPLMTRGFHPGEPCGSEGLSIPVPDERVSMEITPPDHQNRGTKRSSSTPLTTLDPRATDGPIDEGTWKMLCPFSGACF